MWRFQYAHRMDIEQGAKLAGLIVSRCFCVHYNAEASPYLSAGVIFEMMGKVAVTRTSGIHEGSYTLLDYMRLLSCKAWQDAFKKIDG